MSKRTAAILGLLAAKADEPFTIPAVYRLHLRDGKHHLVDMAIPPHIWRAADTSTVLTEVACVLALGQYRPRANDPAGELVGCAFRYLGWWVENQPTDWLGRHRTAKLAGQGRLWQHPDRQHVRLVLAVDRHGITYQALHRDDGHTERLMALPGRQDLQMAGATVEALDIMVAQLCGVGIPPRPSAYAETTEGMN